MNQRACRDCGDPVSGLNLRCDDCKRLHKNKGERDRYHAANAGVDPASIPLGQQVVDLTQPGSASKPPDFSGVPRKLAQEWTEPEVVDYIRGDSAPRFGVPRKPDLSKVPGAVRRDFVQAHEMARKLSATQQDETERPTWSEESRTPLAATANFGGPSFRDRPTVTPSPWAAAVLGDVARPYRPARPVQNSQHVPHIISG